MKYAEARERIYRSWKTGWDNLTRFTLANENFEPDENAWARCTVQPRDSQQDTLGPENNRSFKRTGVVFIQLFTPVHKGTKEMGALVERVLEIFEGKRIAGTTICFQSALPKPATVEGVWYNSTVEIVFTYYEVK